MDCRVANAPRSDGSCVAKAPRSDRCRVHCGAVDEYIVIARPQAVAIHVNPRLLAMKGSDLIQAWTATSLTLLAVTEVASLTLLAVTSVARPQAVAKCRHCEAVGRGNPRLLALAQVSSLHHGLPRR